MKHWDINALEAKPHTPRILSSTQDARTIVLDLPAGERLQEHEVRERAFVLLITGEVLITTKTEEAVSGGPGLLVEFDPRERHEVLAHTDARLLLLLTPWPAPDHAGGVLTIEEKAEVRERAAEHHDDTAA